MYWSCFCYGPRHSCQVLKKTRIIKYYNPAILIPTKLFQGAFYCTPVKRSLKIFSCRITAGNPGQVRWLHLGCSGNQSKLATVWYILPTQAANYSPRFSLLDCQSQHNIWCILPASGDQWQHKISFTLSAQSANPSTKSVLHLA